MDTLGQILWFIMFGTPLITIPIVWKLSKQKKMVKILMGLLLGLVLSFILYHISMSIIFRDGMGSG